MSTRDDGPPRVYRELLRRVLCGSMVGGTILGDLEEEYQARVVESDGRQAADRWFRMQARRLLMRALYERISTPRTWRKRRSCAMPDERGSGNAVVTDLLGEFRQATRSLSRSPGFAVITLLTLAIGIGANTALFSVVRGVLLEPLPFEDADELMVVLAAAPAFGDAEFGSPFEVLQEYQESVPLDRSAAYVTYGATLRLGDVAERVRGADVGAGFFTTLGVEPLVGRFPTAEDVRSAPGELAVIGHALWTQYLGADPGVIGRSAEIAERVRTIVAVMPPEVRFPEEGVAGGRGATMVWLPFVPARRSGTLGSWVWSLLVRVPSGVGADDLTRQLEPVAVTLPERYASDNDRVLRDGQYRPVVRPLRQVVTRDLDSLLWTVFGAAWLVLLIAAVNVANLFLVRAETRRPELAVRAALGAGRVRLLREQMAEAVVLALVGGTLGIALAAWATPFLLGAVPGGLPRTYNVRITGEVLAFTVVLSVATAVLFGLIPALRNATPDADGLHAAGRGADASKRRRATRKVLIVAQSALALVLLVGSGLLVRSFWILSKTDPGFETRDLLTFQISPRPDRYPGSRQAAAFHQSFLDRIAAMPGVESVGAINNLPLDESPAMRDFVTEDYSATHADAARLAIYNFASAGYFRTMGIALLEGRDFHGTDDVRDRGAVIVSRSLAEQDWPSRTALGARLRPSSQEGVWHTVVGVVEDIRPRELRQAGEPMIYFPFVPPAGDDAWRVSSPVYTVRARDPERLAAAIRDELRAVEPSAPMYLVQTMEWHAERSMARLSFTMLVLLVAGGVALLLGTVGLYGVLSHLVGQRSREIGIRMAIGARPEDVRRMTLLEGGRLIVLGLVLGTAAAVALTRLLTSILYETTPLDPMTFIATAMALLMTGLLASWLPARRASAVDPMRTIRGDA